VSVFRPSRIRNGKRVRSAKYRGRFRLTGQPMRDVPLHTTDKRVIWYARLSTKPRASLHHAHCEKLPGGQWRSTWRISWPTWKRRGGSGSIAAW
jgi:hypothetical protein